MTLNSIFTRFNMYDALEHGNRLTVKHIHKHTTLQLWLVYLVIVVELQNQL
jgi:surface polysaccharide O-acyltransferase-like enzyme